MKNIIKFPFIFWIRIYKRYWFCNFYKTRGANFTEIQFFKWAISIGSPWRNHIFKSKSAMENAKRTNDCNKIKGIQIGRYKKEQNYDSI